MRAADQQGEGRLERLGGLRGVACASQPISKDEFSSLLGPASMHAVGHIAANLSFAAVAISLTHTVKTLEPAFNVLLSKTILGVGTPAPVVATLVPIMARPPAVYLPCVTRTCCACRWACPAASSAHVMRMHCADNGAPAWSALNSRLRPLPCQSQYAMHREQRCHRASQARAGRDAAPTRAG